MQKIRPLHNRSGARASLAVAEDLEGIVDSNGNVQRCTTAGTSGGSAPSWATTLNATTNDSGAVWTLVAFHTAPVPMIGHVVVPAFPYTGGGNYSGTYTVSM